MKIVRLEAENLKRLRAVDISPKDDVIIVSGKNSHGKTSLLDSIFYLLAGKKGIPSQPTRNGENKARIKAHLGGKTVELIVERIFTRSKEGDDYTTSVTVTNGEGFTPPGGAQAILDAVLGELSFDPLAFDRMSDAQQFAELLRVFPIGIDPVEIDGLNRTDYAARTKVNTDAKAAKVKAEAITVAPDLPTTPIDESALLDKMTAAADSNAQTEARKGKRNDTKQIIVNAKAQADQFRRQAEQVRREAERLDNEAKAKDTEAEQLQKKLDDAPVLPDPVDIATIRAELDAAKATNAAIGARQRREELATEAKRLEAESKRLTGQMETREQAKRDAVAAAKFPVDGLGFGDGIVTFNGVPFEQASASERLKVSVAIGFAANPELRVMLVRDGSLLDEDSRAQIAAMAKDADTQLWIEVAGTGETTGFVIEDGTARAATDAPNV